MLPLPALRPLTSCMRPLPAALTPPSPSPRPRCHQVGVSWFFHTIGSGVFLDCTSLPTDGSIEVYKDRQEWRERHGWEEWVGDDHILGEMEDDEQ